MQREVLESAAVYTPKWRTGNSTITGASAGKGCAKATMGAWSQAVERKPTLNSQLMRRTEKVIVPFNADALEM